MQDVVVSPVTLLPLKACCDGTKCQAMAERDNVTQRLRRVPKTLVTAPNALFQALPRALLTSMESYA